MTRSLPDEERPDLLSLHDAVEDGGVFPIGDDGVDPLGRAQIRRAELRPHAAGPAPRSGAARQLIDALVDGLDAADQLRVLVEPRILVIEAVDIRQDD